MVSCMDAMETASSAATEDLELEKCFNAAHGDPSRCARDNVGELILHWPVQSMLNRLALLKQAFSRSA